MAFKKIKACEHYYTYVTLRSSVQSMGELLLTTRTKCNSQRGSKLVDFAEKDMASVKEFLTFEASRAKRNQKILRTS